MLRQDMHHWVRNSMGRRRGRGGCTWPQERGGILGVTAGAVLQEGSRQGSLRTAEPLSSLSWWTPQLDGLWRSHQVEALGLGPASSPVLGLLITNYCYLPNQWWSTWTMPLGSGLRAHSLPQGSSLSLSLYCLWQVTGPLLCSGKGACSLWRRVSPELNSL